MDVDARRQTPVSARNVGDMGQDAQLDLAVIERHQQIARLGNERLADAAAFFGADRNILQVRIGEASRPVDAPEIE